MKKIAMLTLLFSSSGALADMIVTMDMDLLCKDEQQSSPFQHAVKIITNRTETVVTIVESEKEFKGPSIIGGTEGGPLYAQYRDSQNSISLDFFGGDIERLSYETNLIQNATTPVRFQIGDTELNLICRGKLGFFRR